MSLKGICLNIIAPALNIGFGIWMESFRFIEMHPVSGLGQKSEMEWEIRFVVSFSSVQFSAYVN